MTDDRPALELVGISHRYGRGPTVLHDVHLSVDAGNTVALMGPSGSGKSTLLAIAGLLTTPSSGEVRVDGTRVPKSDSGRSRLRTERYSWVFQTVNVFGARTAQDNVEVGLLAQGTPRREARKRAGEALTAVGLADHRNKPVRTLSGGEVQRVCIARATALRPLIILADEPTGQLDRGTSDAVLDALWEARHPDTVLVVATHDPEVAHRCDRVIQLVDGSAEVIDP
jgi:ABC-type lipoprotein export system ATPase subunit